MKFPLKSNPAVNIEITPLIDIVFILVIFFVATSKISESQFLNIDLPELDLTLWFMKTNKIIK